MSDRIERAIDTMLEQSGQHDLRSMTLFAPYTTDVEVMVAAGHLRAAGFKPNILPGDGFDIPRIVVMVSEDEDALATLKELGGKWARAQIEFNR